MSNMSRSEAIKQLRLLKADITNGLSFVSKTKDKNLSLESLDMAIASLETDEAYQLEYESTTNNDLGVDLIPREKVMQILQEHWLSGTVAHRIIAEIGNDIQRLPSVSQEPKTGHWISHREHCENLGVMPSGLGVYEWCSNCDCGIDVREWHRNYYNYCPNCGADMREVEE